MAKKITFEQKILDSAAGLFVRFGFSKTSMGDIAKHAGISRATLYNVFPDKLAVIKAYVNAQLSSVKYLLDAVLHENSIPQMRLRKLMKAQVVLFGEWYRKYPHQPQEYLATYKTSTANRKPVLEYYERLYSEILTQIAAQSPRSIKRKALLAHALVNVLKCFEIEYITRNDTNAVLDELDCLVENLVGCGTNKNDGCYYDAGVTAADADDCVS